MIEVTTGLHLSIRNAHILRIVWVSIPDVSSIFQITGILVILFDLS